MGLDFTFSKLQELSEAISKSKYVPLTVKDYLLLKKKPKKFIIIRHDVDVSPEDQMRLAKIERELDISSTYYFRMTKEIFQPNIIKKIAESGHEIGYHYETLSKAKGDYCEAIRLFEQELVALRKIADVSTVCMHGSPLSKWDNRRLWEKYDFHKFQLRRNKLHP